MIKKTGKTTTASTRAAAASFAGVSDIEQLVSNYLRSGLGFIKSQTHDQLAEYLCDKIEREHAERGKLIADLEQQLGADQLSHTRAQLTKQIDAVRAQQIPPQYRNCPVVVALREVHQPRRTPSNPDRTAWCANQRRAWVGISLRTWKRYHLSDHVDQLISHIDQLDMSAYSKISHQI